MSRPAIDAGLCATCAFARPVTSSRGTTFLRCARADADPRYAKYPALPVVACPGYVRPATTPGC